MKPITEEKRQALIADCEADIEDLERDIQRCDAIGTSDYLYHLQSKLQRQQIALASLETEPVAYISDAKLKTLSQGIHSVSVKPDAVMVRPNALYTAPPVPVMQAVDLSACRTLWYEHDDLSAEIECIPVRDLKKAIRAAGGEVKK